MGIFAPQYRDGVEALRHLVSAFYHPGFSFGDFLARHADCRDQLIDMLMGNVFRHPVDRVLAALDQELNRATADTALSS